MQKDIISHTHVGGTPNTTASVQIKPHINAKNKHKRIDRIEIVARVLRLFSFSASFVCSSSVGGSFAFWVMSKKEIKFSIKLDVDGKEQCQKWRSYSSWFQAFPLSVLPILCDEPQSTHMDSSLFTCSASSTVFPVPVRHLYHHRLIRTKCHINPFFHFCLVVVKSYFLHINFVSATTSRVFLYESSNWHW